MELCIKLYAGILFLAIFGSIAKNLHVCVWVVGQDIIVYQKFVFQISWMHSVMCRCLCHVILVCDQAECAFAITYTWYIAFHIGPGRNLVRIQSFYPFVVCQRAFFSKKKYFLKYVHYCFVCIKSLSHGFISFSLFVTKALFHRWSSCLYMCCKPSTSGDFIFLLFVAKPFPAA